ncbi:MAG TPA: DNA polymerase III subunit delta [Firmicutes bacterium]|nr:DNA polymerase III subunit delta [Bacillota bacterium]
MKIKELAQNLAAGKKSSCYFLLGDDVTARKEALQLLKKHFLTGEDENWNYMEYDGAAGTSGEFLSTVYTVPFFGDRRLVVLRSFNLLPLEEQEAVCRLFSSPPPANVAVLMADTIDKRTKVAKTLLSQAVLVELTQPAPEELPAWLMDQAQRIGLHLDHQAVAVLLETAGHNTSFLLQELEKLKTYAWKPDAGASCSVTAGEVALLASTGEPEATAYAGLRLAEAVADGRIEESLSLLSELYALNEPPLRILGALAYHYRLLLAAKSWPASQAEQAAQAISVSLYPMQKAFRQARTLFQTEIERALALLSTADMEMKRLADQKGYLATLLVKLGQRKTPGADDGRQYPVYHY